MDLEQKILSLIDDANYVEATEQHAKLSTPISPYASLQIARAYHCLGNYEAALKLLEKIPYQDYPGIACKYEGVILQLKERYLLQKSITISLQKVQLLLKSSQLSRHHIQALQQLKTIVNSNVQPKAAPKLYQEAKQFISIMEEQTGMPDTNPLNWEGFPGYVISKCWFQQWKNYVRINDRAIDRSNPGVISQFQILDHRFYHLQDPSSQKGYTNQLLFDIQQIIILTSRCWNYLSQRYGGVFIERFSTLNSSNIIQTQTQLQKIIVNMKGELTTKYFIQMSRTSFWKDVEDKLIRIWGKGNVWKSISGRMYPIEPYKLLQNDDLSNMQIVFEKNTNLNPKQLEIRKCVNCGKSQNLKLCKDCRSVRYCNMQCMKNHRSKHQKACRIFAKKYIELDNLSIKYNLNIAENVKGKKGIVGLRNLGNTCYINSSLQCLSNTKQMTNFFMSGDFIKQLNMTNVLGSGGQVACYYAKLIRQLWTSSENAISSWELKRQICKKFSQFAGYSQHDSLQFLGALLDVLHEDTNLVKVKPITSQKQDQRNDKQASDQAYQNYQKRNRSFLSDCLTSQYKTTIVCPKCQRKITTFQHFTLLPLPIPQSFQIELNFIRFKYPNQKLTINLYPYDKIMGIAGALSKRYNLDPRELRFFRLGDDYSFKEEHQLQGSVEQLTHLGKGQINTCYQIPLQDEKTSKIYQIQFFDDSKTDKVSYPRFVSIPFNSNENSVQKLIKECLKIYTNYEVKDSHFQWKAKDHSIEIYLTKNIFSRQSYYGSVQQIEVHKEIQSSSIKNCFNLFCRQQTLDQKNMWYCKNCKQDVRAVRCIQLYKVNKFLIIAFKRYSRGRKIKIMIDYPLQGLEMGDMGSSESGVYDLYGVVNHYGSLINGHYTAYCKNWMDKRWYQFNDSKVSEIKEQMVVNANAYILFYRRRD